MPYFTLAKWIGAGLLALFVIGAVVRVVTTVNGWRHDSAALPQVTAARDQAVQERDAARKAKADEQTKFAGTLDTLTARITNLEAMYGALLANQAADAARRDRDFAHFKEATANVSPNAAFGSPDDMLIRRELFNLLANPDTGQLGRGGAGDGQSQSRASVPGAAIQPDHVPGRSGAAHDQNGAVVPAAGKGGRSHRKRAAQGRHRRGARLGAAGATRPVKAERLGPTLSSTVTVRAAAKHADAAERFARALSDALDIPVGVKVHG